MEILKAYISYRDQGYACLPVSKAKTPAIPAGSSWNGGWFNNSEYEGAFGIGLVCGKASGNLEVIDFDNHFNDAEEIFTRFGETPEVNEIIAKYNFPIEKSTRGGFHLLYRCNKIGGNEKLAERVNGEGRPDVLIETRGEGGYICCGPTPGYKFFNRNGQLDIPEITEEERDVLLTVCRSFNEVIKTRVKTAAEATDRPGDIYNRAAGAIEDMKSALRSSGWTELSGGKWRRPGKDRGVSATLGIAAPGIFYNFSSSAHPFENQHGYTAFQVVGLLSYSGDFQRLARELHEKQSPIEQTKAPLPPSALPLKNFDPASLEQKLRVNPLTDVSEPPAVLYFRKDDTLIPSFTLQSFSLLKGKAKTRKTFLSVLHMASFLGFENSKTVRNPVHKGKVLYCDTEQSDYQLTRMVRRICSMIGNPNPPDLLAFGLKTLTPGEKLQFIEYMIRKTPDLKLVCIDGIRDLVFDINSPVEATMTSVKLMQLAKDFNIHIINVLHENKSDGNARGHLGSELVNKSETVMSVSSEDDISTVEIEYSREIDPGPFSFTINDDSLPEMCDNPEKEEQNKVTLTPAFYPEEKHIMVLDSIYRRKKGEPPSYKELMDDIIREFDYAFRETKCRMFINHYLFKEWIKKERNGHKIIYKYERALF